MDIDFKKIGLAAKDIVFGIGSVAAGATGGPAAAEGVSKAGSGLDSILGMAGVTESRADKFDRADFAARPQQQLLLPAQATTSPAAEAKKTEPLPSSPDSPRIASRDAERSRPSEVEPLTGDVGTAADHLRSLGWSADKIGQILRGPEHTSLAALLGESEGFNSDSEYGAHIVHGALQEAGWHPEARQAILRGPYAFADYMKPAQHVPSDDEIARFEQHDVDEILQANLHHTTERGGHTPDLYHGTHDAQLAELGVTTEHPGTTEA